MTSRATFPSAFHPSATGANSRANAGLLFPSRARKLADSSQRAFARVAEAGGRTPYAGLVSALFHNLRAVLRDRRETARSAWGHFRRINQSERAVSRPPAVTRIQFLQEPGCRFRIAFYGPSFAGFHDQQHERGALECPARVMKDWTK